MMNSLYIFIMFVLPCFFGGLGAVLRCAMTKKISTSHVSEVPVATLFINCLASFVLGVVSNVFMVTVTIFGARFVYLMTLGFLGGFSTFSTAIFEGVHLIQSKRIKEGLFLLVAELIAPFLSASVGYVGSQILLLSLV